MIIRTYKEKDWPKLKELIMEQWNDEYTYNAVDYDLLDPYRYRDEYVADADNYKFFLAEDQDGLCGFIFVSYGQKCINLEYIYVAQRKRRQGVSLALMKQIEIYGSSIGKKEIIVHSVVKNDRSHELKQKLGYVFETTRYIARKAL